MFASRRAAYIVHESGVRRLTAATATAETPTATMVSKSTTTTMDPIEYKPFSDAQEFSNLMRSLFKLYAWYREAMYPFSFLQKTKDLKVVCKDATSEKVEFVIPAGLENALQNSEMINSPESNSTVVSAPTDCSWAGWTSIAIGS
ncbi:hypothetical protein D8B26_004924 [Coccidioides posadasii str. Silveira]|uniref:uncharacterized protein n=1 Tax=Coccidioides posadasii (strain RMSCC 757 / Silveira) TaxID=443226 RepID=UPI001BEFB56C|nr:hypothetical protein D8B26_004924 [Coccidioides posadasii str. Silveira]